MDTSNPTPHRPARPIHAQPVRAQARTQAVPGLAVALAALLTSVSAGQAWAQGAPLLPRWEAGGFGLAVSQQAYPGSDQQVQRTLLLPYVVYRGEVLRADRGNAGLRAFKADAFELDLGASAALGSSSRQIEARRGMADLGTLIELGPRLRWTLQRQADGSIWRLDLPLRSVHSLNDGLQRKGTTFEPELKWQGPLGRGFFLNTGLSAVLADQQLAQTFYGVEAAQATPNRPAYSARAGLLTVRLAGALAWRVAPDWNAFTYARLDSVSGAANEASPLVRQTLGVSAGVGLSYVWRRSALPAVD